MRKKKNKKPFKRNWRWYLKKYGLSQETWERMYADQAGCCFICQRHESKIRRSRSKTLAVDHCHNTNRIRGLLCGYCNTLLTQFVNDDRAKAYRILKYLSRYTDYGFAPENRDRPKYLQNLLRQEAA